MPKYLVYGTVTATTFVGEFEADDEAEAKEKAWKQAGVTVCHHCARDISDPEVTELHVEPADGQ